MAVDSSERCGFRLEVGLTEKDLEADQCDRPVWKDHDRCIWHAPVDGKSAEQFENKGVDPGENIDGAYLREASLVGVEWLAGKSLVAADLTEAEVNNADFSDANLTLATLTNVSAINADFSGANLEGAIFTNADLRRANLEESLLNEAVFTDVHIAGETNFGDISIYDRESIQPKFGNTHPLEAAAWAYRQLQQLYQENSLPRLARRSYNQEKDARRRLAWDDGNYREAIKWELSRLVMNYGSSPYRVLVVSLFVIVVSALLYPLTGGIQETQDGQSITYAIENPQTAPNFWIAQVLYKSFYFSIVTFATLGYGDIQPIGMTARMLASVETILGSLLSALLVFVLARIVTW